MNDGKNGNPPAAGPVVQSLTIEWVQDPQSGQCGLQLKTTESLATALGLVKIAEDFYKNALAAGAQAIAAPRVAVPTARGVRLS